MNAIVLGIVSQGNGGTGPRRYPSLPMSLALQLVAIEREKRRQRLAPTIAEAKAQIDAQRMDGKKRAAAVMLSKHFAQRRDDLLRNYSPELIQAVKDAASKGRGTSGLATRFSIPRGVVRAIIGERK